MIQKELIKYGANYLKITEEEFLKRIDNLQPIIQKEWKDKKTIIDFYKTTDTYIYSLVNFNKDYRIANLLHPIRYLKDAKILDYGAGIGIIPILLAQHNTTYYYDVEGKTKEFAKYLNKQFHYKTAFVDSEKEALKLDVDIIICVDVLEHLEKPMELVKKITESLEPGKMFLTTGLDFSTGSHIPMHLKTNLEYRQEYKEYMEKNYLILFFHDTPNELIYLWLKK